MLCKKGVLRCLRPATLFKKRLSHRCFPVNFAKFWKNIFSYRTPPVAASQVTLTSSQSNEKNNTVKPPSSGHPK